MIAITHPSMGDVRMSITVTSDDPDRQVADTIALMRQYAIEDSYSAPIKKDLWKLGLSTRHSQHAICDALWRYVKGKIHFTQDHELAAPIAAAGINKDPIVEVLVRPADIANGATQGDCDDYSMYLASLLTACGIPCSFATVAADESNPKNFSHVYVIAYPDGQRYPLDSSHGKYPGWEAPDTYRMKEWPVTMAAHVPGGWQ